MFIAPPAGILLGAVGALHTLPTNAQLLNVAVSVPLRKQAPPPRVLLLAWLGTGGERTDIVAHLTGFLAGFGMGVVLGRVAQQGTAKPMRQWLLGGVSLLSVMLAWKFAL